MVSVFEIKKPQIKAPRVAPLEGASTYAPAGAYVSMHCGGHDADERRFVESDIQSIFVTEYLHVNCVSAFICVHLRLNTATGGL